MDRTDKTEKISFDLNTLPCQLNCWQIVVCLLIKYLSNVFDVYLCSGRTREHRILPGQTHFHQQLPGSCHLWGPGLPPPSWSQPGLQHKALPILQSISSWVQSFRFCVYFLSESAACHSTSAGPQIQTVALQLHVVHWKLSRHSWLVSSHWFSSLIGWSFRLVSLSGWIRKWLSQIPKASETSFQDLEPCCNLMPRVWWPHQRSGMGVAHMMKVLVTYFIIKCFIRKIITITVHYRYRPHHFHATTLTWHMCHLCHVITSSSFTINMFIKISTEKYSINRRMFRSVGLTNNSLSWYKIYDVWQWIQEWIVLCC